MENQLNKESASRLEAIFNTVVDGIITIDQRGVIESMNPSAARLFDYSPEEVIGQKINMLMPQPESNEHDSYLGNFFRTGVGKIIGKGRELKGKRKDGSVFPFWLNVKETNFGNKTIFTGIVHDISDIKQVEKDLVSSEIRLNAIVNSAVDGIILIDKQAIMEVVNPAAAKMFGYTQEELIGLNVKALMPPPYFSSHDQYMANYHDTGVRKIIGIGREVKGKRKDGSVFPFKLSISEVKLPDRTIYAGVIHDISEQKIAQTEIQKLNEQLENKVNERTEKLAEVVNKLLLTNKNLEQQIEETKQAKEALMVSQLELEKALVKEQELNQLKTRFVATASHEFRTPLSTILSSASLISRYQTTETEEKRQKHIKRIKSSVDNLTNILNDFLSISKLEEGKVLHEPCDFDVNRFSLEIIEEMETVEKEGQIIDYQHTGEKWVCLDKKILKNVYFNLLSNATKYSPSNAIIEFKTKTTETHFEFFVKDSGIGIPKNEQLHLFERFFRAQNAMNLKGTGLGLNIVKKYVHLMGGKISFESAENEGTTFFVTLPLY